jgi:hypothetical protein
MAPMLVVRVRALWPARGELVSEVPRLRLAAPSLAVLLGSRVCARAREEQTSEGLRARDVTGSGERGMPGAAPGREVQAAVTTR